jgi:hypothetical protein
MLVRYIFAGAAAAGAVAAAPIFRLVFRLARFTIALRHLLGRAALSHPSNLAVWIGGERVSPDLGTIGAPD